MPEPNRACPSQRIAWATFSTALTDYWLFDESGQKLCKRTVFEQNFVTPENIYGESDQPKLDIIASGHDFRYTLKSRCECDPEYSSLQADHEAVEKEILLEVITEKLIKFCMKTPGCGKLLKSKIVAAEFCLSILDVANDIKKEVKRRYK